MKKMILVTMLMASGAAFAGKMTQKEAKTECLKENASIAGTELKQCIKNKVSK